MKTLILIFTILVTTTAGAGELERMEDIAARYGVSYLCSESEFFSMNGLPYVTCKILFEDGETKIVDNYVNYVSEHDGYMWNNTMQISREEDDMVVYPPDCEDVGILIDHNNDGVWDNCKYYTEEHQDKENVEENYYLAQAGTHEEDDIYLDVADAEGTITFELSDTSESTITYEGWEEEDVNPPTVTSVIFYGEIDDIKVESEIWDDQQMEYYLTGTEKGGDMISFMLNWVWTLFLIVGYVGLTLVVGTFILRHNSKRTISRLLKKGNHGKLTAEDIFELLVAYVGWPFYIAALAVLTILKYMLWVPMKSGIRYTANNLPEIKIVKKGKK